jgi:hypothetical protein
VWKAIAAAARRSAEGGLHTIAATTPRCRSVMRCSARLRWLHVPLSFRFPQALGSVECCRLRQPRSPACPHGCKHPVNTPLVGAVGASLCKQRRGSCSGLAEAGAGAQSAAFAGQREVSAICHLISRMRSPPPRSAASRPAQSAAQAVGVAGACIAVLVLLRGVRARVSLTRHQRCLDAIACALFVEASMRHPCGVRSAG